MENISVKNLWNRIQDALGYVTSSHSLARSASDSFLVNDIELTFCGDGYKKAFMIIGEDIENPVEVWNTQGGLKWAWRTLKEKGII